jgi:hypothetical protein
MASLHENSIMSVYNGPNSQRSRQLFRAEAPGPGAFPTPCCDCTFYVRHHGSAKPSDEKRKRVALTVAQS